MVLHMNLIGYMYNYINNVVEMIRYLLTVSHILSLNPH